MAIESDLVRADMVEAMEFPYLANKYQVFGVPLTVANETIRIEGGLPEAPFVGRLMEGLSTGILQTRS